MLARAQQHSPHSRARASAVFMQRVSATCTPSRVHVHAKLAQCRSSRRFSPRIPRTRVVQGMATDAGGEASLSRSGKCFCEHTTVTLTGTPVAVSICHCSICRKLSGAPFTIQALCKAEQVVVEHEGAPSETASSANVSRCRCAKCGSPIYASLMKGRMIAIPLTVLNSSLNTPGVSATNLKPTHHMYYPQRIFDVNDDLPKFVKSKGEIWTPESDLADNQNGGD
jgi:hypothetical protein